ncbi:MAG: hypothetical protein IKE91_03260 [Clostridia bacterium]|nr:hypothetical protein [Clostridia bacterium]
MKKLLKSMLVFSLLAAVCVAFAGCGKKDDKKKDENGSIVGSKYFESGSYNETIEAVLDGDGNASKFIITIIPDDAEKVETMKSLVQTIADESESSNLNVEDNKIILEMSAEDFLSEEGLTFEDGKISKDQVKELFESNGFTVEEK